MRTNKDRERNHKRRSKKRSKKRSKRKFGKFEKFENNEVEINNDTIDKPSENIMKKQLKNVSDITGISILKKKGIVPYFFNKFNDSVFPKLTEERERNLSLKKKFLLWLIRQGGSTRDYITQSYAYMLHKGNFLERMIASDSL